MNSNGRCKPVNIWHPCIASLLCAITAGVGILGFMLVYALVGFIIALVFTVVSLSIGIGLIMIKQRRGLYTKKTDKGIFIYAYGERI